ncbi:MAG: PaaI family thioesterase [Candidatus Kariarchaeaceae archaeon]|jgi:acyl-coenzyme A thioesterase PaaI-like protein
MEKSVQETFGPDGICFGCGPKNDRGLRIRSFWEGDELVLRFNTETHHQAFNNVINGGIIGALFDCHGNWAAATRLHELHPDDEFPSTVTSTFTVNLKRPTPADQELLIKARVTNVDENMVDVEMEMYAMVRGEMKVTSTSTATYASVPEGHPAYHRWS